MTCINCINQIKPKNPPYSTCKFLKTYKVGCYTFKPKYKFNIWR